MRFQKLLLTAAIAGLLMGASGGPALASCGDGVLVNEKFDTTLVVDGEASCVIISSEFAENLLVLGTANVVLVNNKVLGDLEVTGFGSGEATVVANTILKGNLVVRRLTTANVVENETLVGNMRVNKNVKALVQKNIAISGSITCNNDETDAFFNAARGGDSCFPQP